MPRQLNKLNARLVANLTKPGRHSDGGGLYLSVSKDRISIRRRWVFLFRWRDEAGGIGKPTEMGLGAATAVSLGKARELAAQFRAELAAGINPKDARDARRKKQAGIPTFAECADALIASKGSGWRSPKHVWQWKQTLDKYAAPISAKAVDKITTEDVLAILQPYWSTKAETASRLRSRIEAVLDAARAKGHIPPGTANPARWRGHLDKLLAKRQKLQRGHHPAMPFADVPAFMAQLRARAATTALALEFTILTAARSGEALGAKWSEFDLTAKVWTVPAERMKRGIEHRVPLPDRATEIVENLRETKRSDLVFPSHSGDRPLSSMAMTMLLRRMKADQFTVHGFRSSFRDWAGECTSFPREVAEAALAHAIGDQTERAYRRGDALEKRRKLMDAWGSYLNRPRSAGDNVRPFAKTRV
jgi:integrase